MFSEPNLEAGTLFSKEAKVPSFLCLIALLFKRQRCFTEKELEGGGGNQPYCITFFPLIAATTKLESFGFGDYAIPLLDQLHWLLAYFQDTVQDTGHSFRALNSIRQDSLKAHFLLATLRVGS